MRRRRERMVAAGLFAGYFIALAIVALWPEHLDGQGGERVAPLLDWIAGYGIRPGVSYAVLEFTGNILLFLPAGVLLTVLLPRRLRMLSPVVGVLLSVSAELAQFLFLPGRTSDPRDIVSNSIGFVAGSAAVMFLSRVRHGRYSPHARRRHRIDPPTERAGLPGQAVSTPVLNSTINATPSSTR